MKNTSIGTTLICISILFCTVSYSEASFSCWAAPFVFGPKCQGQGIFGHPGYKKGYRISVTGNASTLVCCEAKGFDAKMKEKWYSIGCGYDSFTGSVPWGNVLATEGARCRGTPFGAFVSVN